MGKEEKCIKALKEFVNRDMLDGVEGFVKEKINKSAKNIEIKKLKKNKEKNNCYCCMFVNTEECSSCPYNSPINKK